MKRITKVDVMFGKESIYRTEKSGDSLFVRVESAIKNYFPGFSEIPRSATNSEIYPDPLDNTKKAYLLKSGDIQDLVLVASSYRNAYTMSIGMLIREKSGQKFVNLMQRSGNSPYEIITSFMGNSSRFSH